MGAGRWPELGPRHYSQFLSLVCLTLCPACSPFQHTLLTATSLIFARTLPCSRTFSDSPLSTKLNQKCISLLILYLCHLATTKPLPFVSFSPSKYSAQVDVWRLRKQASRAAFPVCNSSTCCLTLLKSSLVFLIKPKRAPG